MKNKKKVISKNKLFIAFMLFVFVFSLFKVGKSIAANDSFKITNAEVTEKSETAEVNNLSFEGTKITNDITFHNVGDSVTYKVTVKNNDNTNYTIKSVSDDNTNEYISYIYDSYEGVKILANGEATFNVTAKYEKELTDLTKKNQSFSVNINFTLEDENGNIKTNPKTDDNITVYLMTAAASSIMLLIVLRKNMLVKVGRKKSYTNQNKSRRAKHSDRGMKFFSLILAVMIMLPGITKVSNAASNSLVLTFENTFRLYNTPSEIKIQVEYEDEWKPSKKVTIDYSTTYTSNEYIKQYSLDNGETWQNYTGPITINENNKLVKARVVLKDTNEVVDSTQKTVIKVDPVVPTISIDLGGSYYSGQALDLAEVTTTTYGESGATVKWTIDGIEVTNMSETNKIDKMEEQYEVKVVATITSGAGLTATATSQTLIIKYARWNTYLLDGVLTKENIQNIKFCAWDEKPENPTGSFDNSVSQDSAVMEYYVLDPDTNLYDIYITSPYGYSRYYSDDMKELFAHLHQVRSIDFEYLDMYNITNMHQMFYMAHADSNGYFEQEENYLTDIKWGDKFNTENVTDMEALFGGLNKIPNLDLSKFDTRNVTNLGNIFHHCENLEQLDVSNWDTSKVTNMFCTFNSLKKLKELDISNWDTSNVTNMAQMFYGSAIQKLDISKWDTSNVTNMMAMFYYCTSLQSLDASNWNTSNVTTMYCMFYNCTSLGELTISNWDTSNVTDMRYMFGRCGVQELDLSSFNTSNVTDMNNMFRKCKVKTIDFRHLDLSNVSNLKYMFAEASNLKNVYVEKMPTYKSGANKQDMWTYAGTSNFTVKEYDD